MTDRLGPILCLLLSPLWLACEPSGAPQASASVARDPAAAAAEPAGPDADALLQRKLDAEYPRHGVVTATELRVLGKPDPDATVVGWLRIGGRVRLGAERVDGKGCPGRDYRAIYPTGFVCVGDGLATADGPVEVEVPSDEGWKNGQVEAAEKRGAVVVPPAARDEPLPYDYYFVKERAVPSYHRLPSRDEQRAALAKTEHYLELYDKSPERARDYLAGELATGPSGTEVAARYLDHGFFVASNGTELRASRRFVRTISGRYIKQAQLEPRAPDAFRGVELEGDARLPIAWAVRSAAPLIAREGADGQTTFKEDPELPAIERHTRLTGWRGLRRMGDRLMHELSTPRGPRYLRAWFAAVARAVPPPPGVVGDAPWVHVDVDQQTAVLYRGARPVFATLVSSGLEGHATPTGVFRIRHKRVTDTMADLGPEAGDDRYRIEDVPWTQYFEGSIALHAAFWHTRFGIPRSHGCVNLSPYDAHRIFHDTLPRVPDGWHGVSTEGGAFEGGIVWVTDDALGPLSVDAPAPQAQAEVAPPSDEVLPGQAPLDDAPPDQAAATQAPPDPRGIQASPKSLEPWQKRRPTEVKYTVERGGSARRVANLFRIHHGRMEALNPGVDLDKELRPGTEVVVYRHEADAQSRSLGTPTRGSIEGGAPLPAGEGRILKATPGRMWATRRTIGLLDAVLRAWPQLEPQADPLLVGTLSLPRGGPIAPHQTHQSGRDVDLGYPQLRDPSQPYNWRNMDARNLDARRTWRLLHLLQATGALERVFIDRALQKVLHEHAVDGNLLSSAELETWLEYPRAPGAGTPIVQHVPGHVDHLHVRFSCGGQPGCQ